MNRESLCISVYNSKFRVQTKVLIVQIEYNNMLLLITNIFIRMSGNDF